MHRTYLSQRTLHGHSLLTAAASALLWVSTVPVPVASAAPGDGAIDETARDLLAAHGDAVVTLRAIVDVTLDITGQPSQSGEQTVEFHGTVVSGDGWIVTSYSSTQPQAQTPTLPNGVEVNVQSTVKELRVLWADGEESTATIVFNDPDLDLSVVQPAEPRESPGRVVFAAGGKPEAQVLDEIVMLARQDESIDRLPLIETGRVVASIERPRRMWIPDIGIPGAPAFHEKGEILGLFALRRSEQEQPALIILPANVVGEVLQAARPGHEEPAAGTAGTAEAPDVAGAGRAILEKYQDCVVSLLAVYEVDGNRREAQNVGVVVGEDGLIVTSRSGTGSDLREIRIITGDGSELAGKVVLEDVDLDLAFVQADPANVEEQGLVFVPAPFTDAAVELRAADPVIILTRESAAFFRQPRLAITLVDSVVDRPRRYYRTPGKQAGAPAFSARGELVGIYARRVSGDETRHRMVLPSAHILEAAARARAARDARPAEEADEAAGEGSSPGAQDPSEPDTQ